MSANPLVELVFHPPGGAQSCAFADALKTVLAGAGELRLVSPYIGASVLSPLLRTREEYRIVTDLKACFDADVDEDVAALLRARPQLVRHVDGVHAKAILSEDASYFGSANLTRSGFALRDELGCVVREPQLLQTLASWFEDLWSAGQAASRDLLDVVVEQARVRSQVARGRELPDVTCLPMRPPTARTLGWLLQTTDSRTTTATNSTDGPKVEEIARLLVQLGLSPEQSRTALDLLDEALTVAGLELDDQRLHLRASSKRGYKYPLHVTVCQRYVAWLEREHGVLSFGFILDDETLAQRIATRFEDRLSVGHFARPETPALHVSLDALTDVLPHIRASWHRAIRAEVARPTKAGQTRRTSFSKHRQPGLYSILRSSATRRSIVELVGRGVA